MTRTTVLLLWALTMAALPVSAAPVPKDGEFIKLKDHINVKMRRSEAASGQNEFGLSTPHPCENSFSQEANGCCW